MTSATGNFAELLWPGIHDIWGESYTDYEPLYKKIFTVKQSDKAFEKEQGLTQLPLASVKEQGAPVNYVDPKQGFQEEYVNVTYGIGATVTREMYSDDQYNYINRLPRMLSRSMRYTEEVIGFNHLNNSENSSFTGADGVTLSNSAHPLVGGGTYSNIAATSSDLDQTSLETLTQDLLDAVDDNDFPIRIKPKCLVVPTGFNFTARKLLETANVVGSADNDINPLGGLFTDLVVSPWLTDADAWFIITDAEDGLVWYERWATELERDNEFDTKNLKFTAVGRWASGWTDPRGVFKNPGA